MAKKKQKKVGTSAHVRQRVRKAGSGVKRAYGKTKPIITRTASMLTQAAIEAAVELGHAAENLRESLKHVAQARNKGRKVTAPIKRAAKKTAKAVKRTYSQVTG